ncbi:Dephospho-CoA kinase [bioreactor metagenome]|uniref:Dephospho-CoA kinase n=1 Tax=bioreactor metagenome TaxID=1076179 RepID=A0A645AF67_9ZZZZ
MTIKINAYGLTGNMGCGKSTVAKLLKKRKNVCVLDCDQISKEILFDIKNKSKIEKILGKEVSEAEIIFKDPIKKQKLEKFIHPKVWQKVRKEIKNGSKDTIYIVESALIYETKMKSSFKGIILVTCNKKEQFKRIKERNNWTDKQIKERLKNQIPDKNKKGNVLIKIDTNCSMKELESKVEKIYF